MRPIVELKDGWDIPFRVSGGFGVFWLSLDEAYELACELARIPLIRQRLHAGRDAADALIPEKKGP